MEQLFKKQDDDQNSFDVGFRLPDTKQTISNLTLALQKEHKLETEELEKAGQGNKKKQRRGGSICCCEDPNCRIGPFIEKRGD
jgi:hypothetical protein